MINNRDISNNISNLFSNKIKDISNSTFNSSEIKEKIKNIEKLLLEDCKDKNIKIFSVSMFAYFPIDSRRM